MIVLAASRNGRCRQWLIAAALAGCTSADPGIARRRPRVLQDMQTNRRHRSTVRDVALNG